MTKDAFLLDPIGTIRTPFTHLDACPRNIDPEGSEGELHLDPHYLNGIDGLKPGMAILVLYWLHGADRTRLVGRSRRTGEEAGVFALRTPHRPNPIGAGVVEIVAIEGRTIRVRGLDCLDGTPLLDIKPAMQGEHPRPAESSQGVTV